MVTYWMLTVFSICQAAMAKNSPVEVSHLSIRTVKAASAAFRLPNAHLRLKSFARPEGRCDRPIVQIVQLAADRHTLRQG
jgi:hypothetical protein